MIYNCFSYYYICKFKDYLIIIQFIFYFCKVSIRIIFIRFIIILCLFRYAF